MLPSKDEPTKRTITASEFRTKCLQLMREVAATGEEIVITKRGKPVASLLPLEANQGASLEPGLNKQ
ncbi:MAG: type II toxin-antitoxin system Phd/YefM family antitoxin [Chloroflexota bacterium]|nr:type II toxin-antitoxin system Phd/YefM family antitoxin [Chloroflexota bacterium]MDE2969552.1 type II toxin-antitoxin system Phd/YefM family antitoxin [Chloroflexota bacterium]